MANAWPLGAGFADARSVLLSVSGLFFGIVADADRGDDQRYVSRLLRWQWHAGRAADHPEHRGHWSAMATLASVDMSAGRAGSVLLCLVVHIVMLLCLWTLPWPAFWASCNRSLCRGSAGVSAGNRAARPAAVLPVRSAAVPRRRCAPVKKSPLLPGLCPARRVRYGPEWPL